MRVLIADDDRITTAIVSKTLREWNVDTVLAHDGQAAWDMLTSPDRPRLAIVDWMMPKIDGLELTRRVRANPFTASMPIILLTARGMTADKVVGLTSADSVEGSPIAISVKDGTVYLNGSAKVVTPDVMASNGVIHVIDKVILPPAD